MSTSWSEEKQTLLAAVAAAEARAETWRSEALAARAENVQLRAEVAELRAQVKELAELAAAQNQQICDLRAMLRRKMTQRKKTASDAGTPTAPEGDTAAPSQVPPTEPSAGSAAPTAEAPAAGPEPIPEPRKRTRSKGKGWRALPKHLPEVRVTEQVCRCSKCGSTQLIARDTEERARIDVVELIARLRREVLEVKRCKRCGETTTAEPPSLPCPRARFTCGFLAWVVTMKFVLLVPLNRIRRLLESQGVHIAKSTLVRLIDLAATLAQTVDGAHWTELKATDCLATDGTGLKVLIEGAPQAWHAVLDVFTRHETTVYQFALTKHGDEIASLLKGFKGVVMCDAESRLNELCRQEGIRRANCNAHPRREFRDAEKFQPVLAKEAGRFLSTSSPCPQAASIG